MKRTAYPGLTREEALTKQREANKKYARTHTSQSRQKRDMERLGTEEFRRRQQEKARRYYAANREVILAKASAKSKLPASLDKARVWRNADRLKKASFYRAKKRDWYNKNRERVTADRRAAYHNPSVKSAINAANRASYVRHRTVRIKQVGVWKLANPEKAKEIGKRGVLTRRSLSPAGKFTTAAFHARCEYFGWCCVYCRKSLTKTTVTIDHVIPLSKRGSNWPANLVPACSSCNKQKHARTPAQWKAALK